METMKQTAVIMFIISTASRDFMDHHKRRCARTCGPIDFKHHPNKYLILTVINIFLLIVGCLIETVPAMILTIPVLMPISMPLGWTGSILG